MGKFGKRDMHTGTSCEGEGRNWGDISVSQIQPENHQKPGEVWNRLFFTISEGTNPDDTLISYL